MCTNQWYVFIHIISGTKTFHVFNFHSIRPLSTLFTFQRKEKSKKHEFNSKFNWIRYQIFQYLVCFYYSFHSSQETWFRFFRQICRDSFPHLQSSVFSWLYFWAFPKHIQWCWGLDFGQSIVLRTPADSFCFANVLPLCLFPNSSES